MLGAYQKDNNGSQSRGTAHSGPTLRKRSPAAAGKTEQAAASTANFSQATRLPLPAYAKGYGVAGPRLRLGYGGAGSCFS